MRSSRLISASLSYLNWLYSCANCSIAESVILVEGQYSPIWSYSWPSRDLLPPSEFGVGHADMGDPLIPRGKGLLWSLIMNCVVLVGAKATESNLLVEFSLDERAAESGPRPARRLLGWVRCFFLETNWNFPPRQWISEGEKRKSKPSFLSFHFDDIVEFDAFFFVRFWRTTFI